MTGARPSAVATSRAAGRHRLRWTLTRDRGREIAEHQAIATETRMPTYLCKPRSRWQHGTDENTDRLLGQYRPTGADLRTFSQTELATIAHELNRRPRKTHVHRTGRGLRRPCEQH
ncbi:IS30 family transposase [Streptomyces sp. GSL17-111]|uniref:IS30 family transposase n=1 Tax=Streptomyces sp. GSL17-111 TaxID=3121596 RepID=UPI0030F4B217